MEISRQVCRSGLPFPAPGDLPDPGIEPTSLKSPAMADEFFTTVPFGKLMFRYCLPKRACLFESHSPRFQLASNVVVGWTWTISFDFLESEFLISWWWDSDDEIVRACLAQCSAGVKCFGDYSHVHVFFLTLNGFTFDCYVTFLTTVHVLS